MRVALLLVLLLRPDVCRDACEVLDFEYVGREHCKCVCYDPITKGVVRFEDPECIGLDLCGPAAGW